MTMSYTFWHSRTDRPTDLTWLEEAEQSLQDNTWTKPLYVDGGSGWDDPSRQETALRLFNSLAVNSSASTMIVQNASMNERLDEAFSHAMNENKHLCSLTLRNLSRPSAEPGNDENADNQVEAYVVPASVFLNPHLESLNLVKTSLDLEACRNLSEMIRESTSLRSLGLESVQMDHEGLVSVLAAVIMSRSLASLRLNDLEWSKKDIKRFLMAASFNRSLTKLSLERMGLDASDAPELAAFLNRNKHVTELSLRQNRLDADALKVLVVKGVMQNTTLRKLFLSRNFLGDESAKYIVHLLTRCSTLEELCLVESKFMKRGCVDIAKALRYNTGLRVLSMDGNCFETFAGRHILKSLQKGNVQLQSVLDRLPSILARCKRGDYVTWKQVDFYLRANKAGRRFLHDDTVELQDMPNVLAGAGAQADVFYHFLRDSGRFPAPSATAPRDPNAPPRTFVPSEAVAVTTAAAPGAPQKQRQCCPPSA